MYWAIFSIVFFAADAMMVREGLWSNAITLVNILISGLVAFGLYSPLTIYVDEYFEGQFTYVLDFVMIWGLFAVTMVILRAASGTASKTRLRFKNPIDPVGGPLVGSLAAWVLATFVMATLHTSPMGKEQFSGKLVHADVESPSALSAPDLRWLRFVGDMSAPEALGSGSTGRFGAKGFVKIYEDHRTKYEASPTVKVRRG
jgi:Colicin V production protein